MNRYETNNNGTLELFPGDNITYQNNSSRNLLNNNEDSTVYTVATVVIFFNGLLIIILSFLLYKFRRRKVLKASSPLLLGLVLLGCTLLYISIIPALVQSSSSQVTCLITDWFRYVGFTIVYGALGLKTWRVSIILHFHKSRLMRIRDKQLLTRLACLVIITITFLLAQTLYSLYGTAVQDSCGTSSCGTCYFLLDGWTTVSLTGQVTLLLWVAVLCHRTRYAPALYNDHVMSGLVVWNQLVWMAASLLFRSLLQHVESERYRFLILFVESEFTTTITLALTCIPKLVLVLTKRRLIDGVLSDVHGSLRLHRLSVVIDKHGSMKTINCVPCGLLHDVTGAQTAEYEEQTEVAETRENEYTKEEVDALIELTTKLKAEREYYRKQLKEVIVEMTTSEVNCDTEENNDKSPSAMTLFTQQMTRSFDSYNSHVNSLLQQPALPPHPHNKVIARSCWMPNLLHCSDLYNSQLSLTSQQQRRHSHNSNGLCSSCQSLVSATTPLFNCQCQRSTKRDSCFSTVSTCRCRSNTRDSFSNVSTCQCQRSSTRDSLNTISTTLSYNPLETNEVHNPHANDNKLYTNKSDAVKAGCCCCRDEDTQLLKCSCRAARTLQSSLPLDSTTTRAKSSRYKALQRLSWHAPSLFSLTESTAAATSMKNSSSAETVPLSSSQRHHIQRANNCQHDTGNNLSQRHHDVKARPASYCTASTPVVFHI